ncbi:MAG: nuclear transport factor 2 family protein [Candidatus Obscuribacterales bacterium]
MDSNSKQFPIFIVILALALGGASSAQSSKQSHGQSKSMTHSTNVQREESAHKQIGTLEVEMKGQTESSLDKDHTEVLAALQKLLSGLGQRSSDQVGECLSQDVTTFDDRSHKVVYGKEAVLAHIKNNVIGAGENSPVRRIAVYSPFVRVKGDTAMVSFRATKKMADERILESWCSEVYERKDGHWLVLQFRSNWKPAHSREN